MTRVLVLLLVATLAGAAHADPVNAVLGDASWSEAHGGSDPERASEHARITTHLRFVLTRLARVPPPPGARGLRRFAALAELARYVDRGRFPRRTDDPFAGRRPRFIDDRGVHCAVGELIARSGHPDLARAIDRDLEYAYVRDIAVPALAAWADTHGFTIDELAMIQPSYGWEDSPPDEKDAIEKVDHSAPWLAVTCAKQHAFTPSLTFELRGDKTGHMTAYARDQTPFARCLASELGKLIPGGGRYDPDPTPYSVVRTLTLPAPQKLFENSLPAALNIGGCSPRPGPVAETISVTVIGTREGLEVTATTTPSNPDIEACVAPRVREHLTWFERVPDLHATHTMSIPSRFHNLADYLTNGGYGRQFIRDCLDDGTTTDAAVTIHITGARGSDALAVSVANAPAPLAACLERRVQTFLATFTVPLSSPVIPGKTKMYFRVDADIDLAVEIPPPPLLPKASKPAPKPAKPARPAKPPRFTPPKRWRP